MYVIIYIYIYVLEEQDARNFSWLEKSATKNARVPFRKSASKTNEKDQPLLTRLSGYSLVPPKLAGLSVISSSSNPESLYPFHRGKTIRVKKEKGARVYRAPLCNDSFQLVSVR